MPAQSQAAGLRARDLVNYRRAACVFVLMLSVSPTILLYNENYDVHEKLWLEYTTWSNAEGLRDRSRGFIEYEERTYEHAEQDRYTLGAYLFDNWHGVYLTRTEVYSLEPPERTWSNNAGQLPASELALKSPRWSPQGDAKVWSDREREFTTYMLVARDAPEAEQSHHAHIALKGSGAVLRCTAEKGAPIDGQVSFFRSLVKFLPSFSSTGSLLESYTESDQFMHDAIPIECKTDSSQTDSAATDNGPASDAAPATAQAQVCDAWYCDALRVIAIDEYDPVTGIHYLISSVFPHTRATFPAYVIGIYFVFLFFSGVICYQLSRFLAGRQLGAAFARRRARHDRVPAAADIARGGMFIAPGYIEPQEAFELLKAMPLFSGEEFVDAVNDRPVPGGPGARQVYLSSRFVLVRDFAALTGNRFQAERVASLVETTCSEGRSLLILSDIDPKYWLRWRHSADPFSDELFYRREKLIVDLKAYQLPLPEGRDIPVLKSNYRRNWNRSSQDERLLLAGLHYEGVVNYKDLSSLISLYQRGLLDFRDFRFSFNDPHWRRFIAREVSHEEFRRMASRYENKLWLSFRGPILLALLVALGFVAYVAQDEMRIAFSLLATVGGTIATVGAFSAKLRDFRSYLGA